MALTTVDTTALSGTITNAQLAGSIDLTSKVTGALPIANGGTAATTFAAAGLAATPAFQAYLNSSQSISDSTWTKVEFDTEQFDTDSDYDNSSNYRFTPTTAGKYYIYASILPETGANDNNIELVQMKIRRNGVDYSGMQFDFRSDSDGRKFQISASNVMDMNGSSDYAEVFGYLKCGTGTRAFAGGQDNAYFGGYKLIGV